MDVLEDVSARTIHYVYDFSDNWRYVIKVKEIDDAAAGAAYPCFLRAIGACPGCEWLPWLR